MIFPAALVLTAAAATVRVLAPTVGIAAAAGARAVLGGGLISQVDEGHAVLHHVGVVVGVGDLVVHGIVPGLGVIGSRSQGAGIGLVAVADGRGHARVAEIRHSNRVGLAVHHAEVICHNAFRGGVGGLRVTAIFTGVHLHKAVMGQLRADGAVHVVALQGGAFLLEGTIAEAAVAPSGGGDAVIAAVYLLNGLRFRQLLEEIGGTVVEPIDVFVAGVIGGTHVGIKGAAGLTDRLGPVVAGVIGVLAGGAVQQVALAFPVQAGAVRILDVAGQGRLSVPRVLRDAKHPERGVLVAYAAVEGLDGHD